ncbi:MAG: hypothetical protein JWO80_5746 [Bryobacterales bacterium]|nr:hypothetical protein [Bryobacterales bacterium]
MPGIWKSAAAGATGGLIASYAMNEFQSLWQAAAEKVQPGQNSGGGDDATVKTAQAVLRSVAHRDLKPHEKKRAGAAVHYIYGTLIGAAYGLLATRARAVAAGRGTAYGAAVWLAGDEIAVPALGLGKSPKEAPLSSHANALASHLVYGAVTDSVFRLLSGA